MLKLLTILEEKAMIREIINFIDNASNLIILINGIALFLGGGYVAIHSRTVPKWAQTSLWYLGVFGLIAAISIVVEWVDGQMNPFSHFMIGNVINLIMLIIMTVTVGIMFANTVWIDVRKRKERGPKKRVVAKKRPATITSEPAQVTPQPVVRGRRKKV